MAHIRHAGVPIVIYNPAGTICPGFPGIMIAPADGGRIKLIIQNVSYTPCIIYLRSGSDANEFDGIYLYGPAGLIEVNEEEDPEMVVSEWWGFSDSALTPTLTVTAETYR